jgi:hypothetical protein
MEPADSPAFVRHDHRKPRPHFDLRLEEDGVLKSWALPKGLPPTSKANHLAVAVPDHALDHLTYVDADKFIADIGVWRLEDRTDKRFVFVLDGLRGAHRYALINTGRDWLIHRTKVQPTQDQPVQE